MAFEQRDALSSKIEGPVHPDNEVAVLAGVPPIERCAAREEIAVTPFIAQAKPHFGQLVGLLRGGTVPNHNIIVGTARSEARTREIPAAQVMGSTVARKEAEGGDHPMEVQRFRKSGGAEDGF